MTNSTGSLRPLPPSNGRARLKPTQGRAPEVHHRWTGDQATYAAVHQRIVTQRGSASTHDCVRNCGRRALHWAYDHLDLAERRSPDGRSYSLDPDHYQPLCAYCHQQLDGPVILTLDLAREIRTRYALGEETQQDLALVYGVTTGTIQSVTAGTSHRESSGRTSASRSPRTGERYRRDHQGIKNANARLTPWRVRLIRQRHAAGEPTSLLASTYGVTPRHVRAILKGRNWALLPAKRYIQRR